VADYADFRATAKELIDDFGRDITVTRQAAVAADPTKPWRSSTVPALASVTGKGVFVSPSDLGKRVELRDGVKRPDMVVLFAAANDGGQNLETFDTLTDELTVWQILRAELLAPGDTRLLYQFEVAQ